MDAKPLAIPGTIQHSRDARSDADLRNEVIAHHEAQPGVRFLTDVLTAIHAGSDAVRIAGVFHAQFSPRVVMDALERRPDLRARVAHAITGGPLTLLRRIPPADLAAQIELLIAEDLPVDERGVRASDDRDKTVAEIYLKYVELADLAAYLPPRDLWTYECSDSWWEKPGESARNLMATEIKSIRRHKILSDTELLDQIGNEVLERDLSVRVRTEIRAAARKFAAEGKPFTDTAMFDSFQPGEAGHDLVDEIVGCVPLAHLRQLVVRAADLLALTASNPPTATPSGTEGSVARASMPPSAGASAASRTSASSSMSSARTSPSIPPPANTGVAVTSTASESVKSPSIFPAATAATSTVPSGAAMSQSARPLASAASSSIRPPALSVTSGAPAVAPAPSSVTQSVAPPALSSAVSPSPTSSLTRASTPPSSRAPAVAPRASVAPGPLSVSPEGDVQPMVELVDLADDETYGEDRTNSGTDNTGKESAVTASATPTSGSSNATNTSKNSVPGGSASKQRTSVPVEIPDFDEAGSPGAATAPNARNFRRGR